MARVEPLPTLGPAKPAVASPRAVPMEIRPATNPGTITPDALPRLARLTRRLKRRIASLLELSPGQRVLDVGCGAGADAAALGVKLGPTGRAFGIDYDPSMIRAALCGPAGAACAAAQGAPRDSRGRTRRTSEAGRPATPSLLVADASAIPYRDGSFDGCYSERVLQHVDNPAAIVAEMVRVTRRGGRIVIADTDWASLSIDALDARIERALVSFVAESLHNGYAGRQLRRLMVDAGIRDVRVELWPVMWTDYGEFCATSLSLLDLDRRAVSAGAISRADLARLHRSLIDADRHGAFFASGTIVLAHGRCPAERPATERLQEEQ